MPQFGDVASGGAFSANLRWAIRTYNITGSVVAVELIALFFNCLEIKCLGTSASNCYLGTLGDIAAYCAMYLRLACMHVNI